MRPPRALGQTRLSLALLLTLITYTNSQTQKHLVCKQPGTQYCFSWLVNGEDVGIGTHDATNIPEYCGFNNNDKRSVAFHGKFIKVKLIEKNGQIKKIFCKKITFAGRLLNWKEIENPVGIPTRFRRQSFTPRGRYRGQTQSQYLAIDRGNGKDEGRAEAHSAADSSRASVSGNSGMGQAQSQSIYDPNCDDCYGKSAHEVENLQRPTGLKPGESGYILNSGPTWPGHDGFGPSRTQNGGYSPSQTHLYTPGSKIPGAYGTLGGPESLGPNAKPNDGNFQSGGTGPVGSGTIGSGNYRPNGGTGNGFSPHAISGGNDYRPGGTPGAQGSTGGFGPNGSPSRYEPGANGIDNRYTPSGTSRGFGPEGNTGTGGYRTPGISMDGNLRPGTDNNGFGPSGPQGSGLLPDSHLGTNTGPGRDNYPSNQGPNGNMYGPNQGNVQRGNGVGQFGHGPDRPFIASDTYGPGQITNNNKIIPGESDGRARPDTSNIGIGYGPGQGSSNYAPDSGSGMPGAAYGPEGRGIGSPVGFGPGQPGSPNINWPVASGPYPGPGGNIYCCVIPSTGQSIGGTQTPYGISGQQGTPVSRQDGQYGINRPGPITSGGYYIPRPDISTPGQQYGTKTPGAIGSTALPGGQYGSGGPDSTSVPRSQYGSPGDVNLPGEQYGPGGVGQGTIGRPSSPREQYIPRGGVGTNVPSGQYIPDRAGEHFEPNGSGGPSVSGGQYEPGTMPVRQYGTGPSSGTIPGSQYEPSGISGTTVPGGQYIPGVSGGTAVPEGKYGPTVGGVTRPGGQPTLTGNANMPGSQYGPAGVGGATIPGGQYIPESSRGSTLPLGQYGPGGVGSGTVPGGQYIPGSTGGTTIPGNQYGPGGAGATSMPGSQYVPGSSGSTTGPGAQYGPGGVGGASVPGGQYIPGGVGGTTVPGSQYRPGGVGGASIPGGQYIPGSTGSTTVPGGQYGPGGIGGASVPGGQYVPGGVGGTTVPGSQYGPGGVGSGTVPGGQYLPGTTGDANVPGGQFRPAHSGDTGGQYRPGESDGNYAPDGQYGRNGPGGPGTQYGGSNIPYGTGQYGAGEPSGHGTGSKDGMGANGGPYGQQGGTSGTDGQYGTGRYSYYNQGPSRGQGNDYNGVPQNYLDPNSAIIDGDDSEAEANVAQNINGTTASASSKGGNDKGRAQTSVQGTYKGSGSFQAQAQITGENKEAQSEVNGGKKGASSSASGSGRNNKSQANVQLGSETGSVQTQSQSNGVLHSSNSQVQGSVKGGMADAQARGPGSTSSQAQIGFTPYKDKDKASHDLQQIPFTGGGMASAQSSGRTGQSQSQLHGTFKYGITYNGAAQSGASLDKDAVFPSRLSFEKIDVFDEKEKNINVDKINIDITETPQSLDAEMPPSESSTVPEPYQNKQTVDIPTTDNIIDESMKNSESRYSGHAHLDHHTSDSSNSTYSNGPTLLGSRRSFQTNYGTVPEYEFTPVKDENQPEYDTDVGYEGEGNEGEGNEATDVEQNEYPNYDEYSKDLEPNHQYLQSSNRKGIEVQQTTGGNTQHIILGSLKDHNAEIIQKDTERPDEHKVYQPGERVPGTGGYTIPVGFTGSVKSVASKDKTYVVGSKDSPSQAQTVTLTPGTGKVKYTYPSNHGKYVKPKNLRSLQSPKENDNRYVSVSKSVTRALDSDNNIRKQYSHTYYTKSSSCGYFTFTCTMVSSAEGRKKVCKPKMPTNPNGTPIRC